MSESKNVLCVLQDDHRKEYEPEFARLRHTGANFVFESSPEKSLSMVGEIDPNLVIVGMDVGSMEGIEFLALLTSQYPGFSGSVVVLPEKADGMPPVIHSRAHSTGRSAVESVDFDHIAALITQPQPEPSPPAASVPQSVVAPEDLPKRSGRAKWPIPAAAAGGVLVLLIVGYFVFSGGGEAKQNPEGTSDPQKTSAVVDTGPAEKPVEEPGDTKKEVAAAPDPPVAPPDPPVLETQPPVEPEVEAPADLPGKFVLPLSFDEGTGRPRISDADRLDDVISALKRRPDLKIRLTGHTSAPGEVSNNFRLGMLRARMTKRLLVRRGISPRRIRIKSRGEKEPLDSSMTREGNSKNRRVEIQLIH
jgi:outer membrane protein OmpA-like peptidoglycan-associated protein